MQPYSGCGSVQELRESSSDRSTSEMLNRRLDRDDDTVRAMTIHKAKGLEFPVVLCPTLWTTQRLRAGLIRNARRGRQASNTYWVAYGPSKAKAVMRVKTGADAEAQGEDLRICTLRSPEGPLGLVLWTVPGFPGALGRLLIFLSSHVPETLHDWRQEFRGARTGSH